MLYLMMPSGWEIMGPVDSVKLMEKFAHGCHGSSFPSSVIFSLENLHVELDATLDLFSSSRLQLSLNIPLSFRVTANVALLQGKCSQTGVCSAVIVPGS